MADEAMDPLALFSHGQFRALTTNQPDLLLFTNGEFPRSNARPPTPPRKRDQVEGGSGRRRFRDPWEREREIDEQELALLLLLLDE